VSALLALTDNAVQAVRDIVSASEQVPETGGLRLVAERAGTQANFQLSVVSLPAEDDEVIEEQGARVFLEPEAASLLDDSTRPRAIPFEPARGLKGGRATLAECRRSASASRSIRQRRTRPSRCSPPGACMPTAFSLSSEAPTPPRLAVRCSSSRANAWASS
jgi:iron-sulfur cluster assembly protein